MHLLNTEEYTIIQGQLNLDRLVKGKTIPICLHTIHSHEETLVKWPFARDC